MNPGWFVLVNILIYLVNNNNNNKHYENAYDYVSEAFWPLDLELNSSSN